jgi:ATP-dependent Zn protease
MLAWHHRMPMDRVSVRPRASTLGMVRLLPEEGRYARSQSSLWALMSMSFGGLVAETTVFGSHGTGASSDLDAIRSHVRNAVRVEGMDANLPAGVSRQFEAPTSEATLRRAERVEHEIIQSAKSHATSWLNANSETLETLAKLLAEQREIDGPAVEAYLDSRLSQADREQATDNNAALSMAARASRTRAAD